MFTLRAKVHTSSGKFSCMWNGDLKIALMSAVEMGEGFDVKLIAEFASDVMGDPLAHLPTGVDGEHEAAARNLVNREEAHRWIDMIFDADSMVLHW